MRTGDLAPNFELPDHTGAVRKLSDMVSDGPVVLFFYPAASTPMCTAEACRFRDLGLQFGDYHAQRVGISTDATDKNAHFALQRAFDYPLLSDADGHVAEQFGVRRGRWLSRWRRRDTRKSRKHSTKRGAMRQMLSVKRTTFVIDKDRVVRFIVSSERANVHADKTLQYLRYLS